MHEWMTQRLGQKKFLRDISFCKAFPGGSMVKKLPAMQEPQEMCVQLLVRKIPWRRPWKPAPVFLPGESHGQRSLADHSAYGCKKLDMTEVT